MQDLISIFKEVISDYRFAVFLVAAILIILSIIFFLASAGILIKGNPDRDGVDRKKAQKRSLVLSIIGVFIFALGFYLPKPSLGKTHNSNYSKECVYIFKIKNHNDSLKRCLNSNYFNEIDKKQIGAFLKQFENYLEMSNLCSDTTILRIIDEELFYSNENFLMRCR